ncbi:MAG: hypothetical protein J6Y72_10705 [Bacteroidales bacterium]|nr:hypothetical protein [Bacteroidales bacterium]
MRNFFTIVFIVVSLVSCTTSKTTVSNSADLSKYKYASLSDVMSYGGSASMMDIEVLIYDAIEKTSLEMIGDKRISELTDFQKSQLLIVRFAASQSDEESVISVNFVDYTTGRPIASCRGAWGLGLDKDGDLVGAIKRVEKQMIQLWGPKNK